VKVSLEELTGDVEHVLLRLGAPAVEAKVGAEMCLDAELRGHTSHGVRLLRNVAAEYANGASRRRDVTVLAESPVSARIDGGFHLSWFVHRTAVDLVVEKALTSGLAIVSVANAGVSGALSYLAERIASAGLVAVAMNGTPSTVVAPGQSVPSLGTNPLAVALPRRTGTPLVLDMATSSVAFNTILRSREEGKLLPDGVAAGADGKPTTDPHAAIDPATGRGRILPFGGHRGYGLALMLELMVSGGVTGRVAGDKRGPVVQEPADFSGLYLAYRPELVGDADVSLEATERLVEELDAGGARIPGEESRARRAQCLANGEVDVSDETLAWLRATRDQH
jgi:LDH2 family malate/lactate/ureidoglycolate dehydrogenase